MSTNLNINATESTIESILTRPKTFKVPDYQRSYSWNEEQWEDLWYDVQEISKNESHFMGSIVVIQKQDIKERGWMEVIDGQQRLTTISIILSIMRDYYRTEGDENKHSETIESNYLWQRNLEGEKIPNLTLSNFDEEDFVNILEGRYSDLSQSQLKEAYEYFKENINRLEVEEVDELRKKILTSLSVVLIGCENEDAAFRLFETLNDRGMDLSAIDLMKNHLFKIANKDGDLDYPEIKDTWEDLMEDVVHEMDNPDRFFRHYMMSSPLYEISDSISQYKLYDKFRDTLSDIQEREDVNVTDYIKDMQEVSQTYINIKACDIKKFDRNEERRINERLENLSAVGAVQPRTLLLRIFREYESPNQILRLVRMLETFELRRRIVGYSRGSPLDEIYATLCSEAFDKEDSVGNIRNKLIEKCPDDDEFETSISTSSFSNNDMTKYILEMLEMQYYSEGGKNVSNRGSVEIEHIAPKKAFSAKKYSAWASYLNCNEEDFESDRDKIGNLLLLESSYNSSASNKPFEQKKSYYEDSEFKMAESVLNYKEWKVEQIRERTQELARAATKVWSLEN